jgi:hypothetical protein
MSSDRDPRYDTQKMQKALREIKERLHEDIEKVDEPQLKAMFETSAEDSWQQVCRSAWRPADNV